VRAKKGLVKVKDMGMGLLPLEGRVAFIAQKKWKVRAGIALIAFTTLFLYVSSVIRTVDSRKGIIGKITP